MTGFGAESWQNGTFCVRNGWQRAAEAPLRGDVEFAGRWTIRARRNREWFFNSCASLFAVTADNDPMAQRPNRNSSKKCCPVLMDGRTFYTPLFAGVFWEETYTVLEDLHRIEAIRGAGAMLWGANAVNGVIKIITKSARETQGALITGGGNGRARLWCGPLRREICGPSIFQGVREMRQTR